MAEWSKALDLGSSPSVGVGSNPTSVTLFSISGGLAQSVECVVCNDEAPGSKPGFSKLLVGPKQTQRIWYSMRPCSVKFKIAFAGDGVKLVEISWNLNKHKGIVIQRDPVL